MGKPRWEEFGPEQLWQAAQGPVGQREGAERAGHPGIRPASTASVSGLAEKGPCSQSWLTGSRGSCAHPGARFPGVQPVPGPPFP